VTWTHHDVALWVEIVGYGEYKELFLRHRVTGEELADLSTEDLEALGIHSIGHHKRILREVNNLVELPKAPIDDDEDLPRKERHKLMKSRSRNKMRKNSDAFDASALEGFEGDSVVVKCFHKGHDKSAVFTITSNWTLSDLKQRVFAEVNRRCTLSYVNQLGYQVPIKSTWDFKDMLRNALPPVAIYCRSKDLASISSSSSSSSSKKSKSKSLLKGTIRATRHHSSGCPITPAERIVTL